MDDRSQEGRPNRRSFARRFLPLSVLVMAGALLLAFAGSPHQILANLTTHRESLNDIMLRHEFAAAVAYVVVYISLMMLLWIPPWLCTLIGGFLFGIALGTPLALVSACSGATAVFLLARSGLAGLTERAGPFARGLEDGFRRDAFSYLLALRLIPVFPFVVVNLVSAVVGVPVRTFVLATVFGIAPSTLIYASLGNALSGLADGEIALDSRALWEPRFALPLAGLAILALLPVLYKRARGSRPQS